jgi:hypothetical protein
MNGKIFNKREERERGNEANVERGKNRGEPAATGSAWLIANITLEAIHGHLHPSPAKST